MHLLASCELDIRRTRQEAFARVADMERFGDWFPGVIAIESIDDTPEATRGKEYLETVAVPLRAQRKIRLQVTDCIADGFFATEGAFPPLMPRMGVRSVATDAPGCTVRWRMYSRSTSSVARYTITALEVWAWS